VKITIVLEDREDGGLRVWSDDLPGLVLSGRDRLKVGSDIVPAVDALVEYRRSRPSPSALPGTAVER